MRRWAAWSSPRAPGGSPTTSPPPRTRPHRAAALPQGRAAIAEPSIIQSTWRYVCAILDTATERGGLHPLAARSLEDALLTAILLGLPHTGTATLAEEPGKAPTIWPG